MIENWDENNFVVPPCAYMKDALGTTQINLDSIPMSHKVSEDSWLYVLQLLYYHCHCEAVKCEYVQKILGTIVETYKDKDDNTLGSLIRLSRSCVKDQRSVVSGFFSPELKLLFFACKYPLDLD